MSTQNLYLTVTGTPDVDETITHTKVSTTNDKQYCLLDYPLWLYIIFFFIKIYMKTSKGNFNKYDYKYMASGGSKDVFKRKLGFIPTFKTGGKKYPKNKSYVSAFFFRRQDYLDEMKALESMRLVDPMELFTIQPVKVRDLVKEPLLPSLLDHLMTELPEDRREERNREYPYISEMIFPYGGVDYQAELRARKNCTLQDFLFPILFLIFCLGYMHDLGYFHEDIQNQNILFNDAQLFLIDFSDLTKDCKTDFYPKIKFVKYEKPKDEYFLGLYLPAEITYLNYLRGLGFSNDLRDQAKRYHDADFTLKDLLKQVNKHDPDIVKESIFYLKKLKSLERLSLDRCRLDREYKYNVNKRLLLRNQIYLQCFKKHKDPKGNVEMTDAVLKCLEPAINTVQDILLLYADRSESYRLGMTILWWIMTFRNKFYKDLVERDKDMFEKFALSVYENLLVFNVLYRMNLSNFHTHFLKQLRFLGYQDFLQEYKEYCNKVAEKKESNYKNVKQSVKLEKQYFENLFYFIDLLLT